MTVNFLVTMKRSYFYSDKVRCFLLDGDDTIAVGDERWTRTGTWSPVLACHVGQRHSVSKFGIVRRRTPLEPGAMPETYRMLQNGEVIAQGDQTLDPDTDQWLPVMDDMLGNVYSVDRDNPMRRPDVHPANPEAAALAVQASRDIRDGIAELLQEARGQDARSKTGDQKDWHNGVAFGLRVAVGHLLEFIPITAEAKPDILVQTLHEIYYDMNGWVTVAGDPDSADDVLEGMRGSLSKIEVALLAVGKADGLGL